MISPLSGSGLLSSSMALARMPQLQPAHHPIISMSKGGVGIVAQGASAYALVKMDAYPKALDAFSGGRAGLLEWVGTSDYLLSLPLSLAGLAAAYFALDGFTLMMSHVMARLGRQEKIGQEIYFRNGGFTSNATVLNRFFGESVYPVERAAELANRRSDLVFVNGIKVVESSQNEDTVWVSNGSGAIPIVKRSNMINGVFDGRSVRLVLPESISVEFDETPNTHSGPEVGSSVYVFGKATGNYGVQVHQMGLAIRE
ncbi:MAG: hypothetical protein COX62_08770 [Deltaproteobacteria bacterium CG_4_10_14_0_2_um_filter_43_8]|nr:MAG: hypothetical protein COV43_02845 [Deltaproteobacteria bacterium CG11_big_fil_rev_8_21_14_0_20_42_23]PJA18371.1 MAG: hypothetical protein COX62_08770 [Deltaproteobacteria bacterium CG_4_10_14_0_2_um_filter_43_8]PJC63639.1 MAG: hypothetical protein CO021_08455 [Deltaproteobacteria bacterium CG_4_9_14_0_2_um_filter_42_21]